MKRRGPSAADVKREYDLAEGGFVTRCAVAAKVLGLYYIDVYAAMLAYRGPTGAGSVVPVPANFDEVRDAEPPAVEDKITAALRARIRQRK